jgi:tRNA dimethylallyltransferase
MAGTPEPHAPPATDRTHGATRRSESPPPPLIVIAGATATGKSALALALTERLHATLGVPVEIISADSRQVYRGMDIGTAKATPAEQAAVTHHGLDLADPDERFTAADYRRAALTALEAIATRGGIALLVGGTGLYLRAVARGLPLDGGDEDPAIRGSLEARLAEGGLAPLVAELRSRDPDGAERVDLRNPRRVVRALERTIISGSAIPAAPSGYGGPSVWVGLTREPVDHRRAIEARAREQFEGGLLAEAERLRARYPENLPAFSAMGYREAFDVLAGRSDLDHAVAADARRTWVYARRQRTWFRAEPAVTWLPVGEGLLDRTVTALGAFLDLARPAEPVEEM